MKKVWKYLLLAMIVTLTLGMSTQAAVKKVTITRPTKKSKGTITLTAKKPQKAVTLKWTWKTQGKKKNSVKVKSSNSKVLSVKKTGDKTAKLVAKRAGTATITVYANSKVKDVLRITVRQRVTKITPKTQYVFLTKGKSSQIKLSVSPKTASNKAVTYKSSRKSVATVTSKGRITGKKTGVATITVKAKDGSGSSTKVYVTVGTSKTKVKKVTARADKTSLYPGETAKISASVSPSKATNKKVRYESSKTSVATVSSKGVITAKKAGTTYIKVIANDGSKKAAKIKITVKQPVTKITLNTSAVTLTTVAGLDHPTEATLTANIAPSSATAKGLTYSSSNAAVAVVSNGKIVAKGTGTAVN